MTILALSVLKGHTILEENVIIYFVRMVVLKIVGAVWEYVILVLKEL
jgi:hypothetical protein